MRPCFVSLIVVAVSLHASAVSTTNSNGSVMTPNSELTRNQLVATDVSGLLSSESDPNVVFTNGELLVHGERVKIGPDETEVQEIANAAVETNALTVATTNRVALLESSKADKSTLDAHVTNTNNPHGVTAEQIGAVPLVEDANGDKTAVTIGIRISSESVGEYSLANGINVRASGGYSHAEGVNTTASGNYSHAEGVNTTASGNYSHADGVLSLAKDNFSYTWNGEFFRGDNPYPSHGHGTFNINPLGGLDGFYIGEQTLYSILTNKADKAAPSAANNLAALTADGDLADSGKTVGDFLPRVSNGPVNSTFDIGGPLLMNMNGYIQLGVAGFIYGPFDNIQEEMGSKISLRTELDSKADLSMISATNTTFSSAVNAIVDTKADSLANSAVVTNALTVATTNRVALLESSKADKATTLSGYGITDAVPLVEDVNGKKTAVTIGSREIGEPVGLKSLANGYSTTASGRYSHAEGDSTTASGYCSHAEGYYTTASGYCSHAEGYYTNASGEGSHAEGYFTTASGECSHAEGYLSQTKKGDAYAFAWNGDNSKTEEDPYKSHGPGTFNINPLGGLDGFYIGEQTLYSILTNKADKADISATNPTFSSAVLAVGLNIDTNSVAVLNDIAETFGGFPLGAGETATTVGGLLAALAAAVAWLKKNKVSSFEPVGGATATVGNGVANLSDFFTESNSLLTGTIEKKSIPAFSSSSTYEVGEIVIYDGVAYKCVTAITTAEEWTAAHWTLATNSDLAARLKGLKSDGTATDAFATSLLEKQVAKDAIDAEIIEKGTAPDAHLEAPTDERLKLILADNSVAYDSAKALPYKLTSVIGDRVVATMTLTAASTDITLPTISANDTTVKDFILDVTNAYAVEGVATDAGINIPRTDFKLVTRDGESLTAVTTVKAGKSAFICFTQKSPVIVDGTTYPCWCVIQLPFGDPS